jgi:cell wall-associated NlpC family hydrolase
MVKRAEIIETARRALGTPWVHQGRMAPYGLDCIGLTLWTARQLNISDYEPPAYNRHAEWGLFLSYIRAQMNEIPIAEVGPADMVCFRQQIYPCHCGILTAVGPEAKFIHSYLLRKKVVEERYSDLWRKLTVAAFRFPGVED